MVITYFGMACLKVQFGETTLAFNPLGKGGDLKGPRFGADVALVSLRDSNYDGVEALSYGEREPFVVRGPGEYEVNGLSVRGVSTQGPEGKINTVYAVELEGMNLCHLGALAAEDVRDESIEALGAIDVLFVPIYGAGTLDPARAEKVASRLEPKLVVPLYYGARGSAGDSLAAFLKEIGQTHGEPLEKLTLKKKDLEGSEAQVVVLAAQGQ